MHYTLIVKVTHRCNFNCSYCYDAATRKKYGNTDMTSDDVEKILNLFRDEEDASLTWNWHGGEASLMPIEFYRECGKIFRAHPKIKVKQTIQSNGYALTEEFVMMCKEEGIDIGISFDGIFQDQRRVKSAPKVIENAERIARIMHRNGKGKYSEFCKDGLAVGDEGSSEGAVDAAGSAVDEIAQKFTGGVGGICVITPPMTERLIENYKYFIANNISPAFSPVFLSEETQERNVDTQMAKFMNGIYKYLRFAWTECDELQQMERLANTEVSLLFGSPDVYCVNIDCRYKWLGIDPDGSIQPCDLTLDKRYNMGSIHDKGMTVQDAFDSNGYRLYASEVEERLQKHCYRCKNYDFCGGNCNSNIYAATGGFKEVSPELCASTDAFATRTFDFFNEIDVYSAKLSKALEERLVSEEFYTPRECTEFLKEAGIDVPVERDISQPMTSSIQYKMFRVFNPMQRGVNATANEGWNETDEEDGCSSGQHYNKCYVSNKLEYLRKKNPSKDSPEIDIKAAKGLRTLAKRDIFRRNEKKIRELYSEWVEAESGKSEAQMPAGTECQQGQPLEQ